MLHSDRGCHYRWTGWISRIEATDVTRSMCKSGGFPDDAVFEEFCGTVKDAMF